MLDVYRTLDPSVYEILTKATNETGSLPKPDCSTLTDRQAAEVNRFIAGEFDVVLGMLERRLDGPTREDSKVRTKVAELLRSSSDTHRPETREMAANSDDADKPRTSRPAPIHRALIQLADRGGVTTIMTTNFDLLLEGAAKNLRVPAHTYALGTIPRPARRREFAGVLHIHGALTRNPSRYSDLILTDQDFGEFYLRRRIVPDFIYDAARLFHLVLVGYRADDPPMRYLLHSIAAEEGRFDDLKERYIFVGSGEADDVALEDWRARGIEPIRYGLFRPGPCRAPSHAGTVGRTFGDHREAEDRQPGNSAHREIKKG